MKKSLLTALVIGCLCISLPMSLDKNPIVSSIPQSADVSWEGSSVVSVSAIEHQNGSVQWNSITSNQSLIHTGWTLNSACMTASNINETISSLYTLQNTEFISPASYYHIGYWADQVEYVHPQEYALNFSIRSSVHLHDVRFCFYMGSSNNLALTQVTFVQIRANVLGSPHKTTNLASIPLSNVRLPNHNNDLLSTVITDHGNGYISSTNEQLAVASFSNLILEPGMYWIVINGTKNMMQNNHLYLRAYYDDLLQRNTLNRTSDMGQGYPANDFTDANVIFDNLQSDHVATNYNLYMQANWTAFNVDGSDYALRLGINDKSQPVDVFNSVSISETSAGSTEFGFSSPSSLRLNMNTNYSLSKATSNSYNSLYSCNQTTTVWQTTIPITANVSDLDIMSKTIDLTLPSEWTCVLVQSNTLTNLVFTQVSQVVSVNLLGNEVSITINATNTNAIQLTSAPSRVAAGSDYILTLLNPPTGTWQTNLSTPSLAGTLLTIPIPEATPLGMTDINVTYTNTAGTVGCLLVTVEIFQGTQVFVQVQDTAGRVIPGLDVTIENTTYTLDDITDANGNVTAWLEYDLYNITVTALGTPYYWNDTIVDAAHKYIICTLPFKWVFAVSVAITVVPTEKAGDPYAAATVWMNDTQFALSNLQGTHTLNEGVYNLTTKDVNGNHLRQQWVTVVKGGSNTWTITSDYDPKATVIVHVQMANGAAITNQAITYNGTVYITDADGNFTLTAVAYGTYDIAWAYGGKSGSIHAIIDEPTEYFTVVIAEDTADPNTDDNTVVVGGIDGFAMMPLMLVVGLVALIIGTRYRRA